MKFSFVGQVEADLFERTETEWRRQLEENAGNTSAPYYEAGLTYCEKTVNGETITGDGGGCLCAVVEDGKDYAAALLTVSHAKALPARSFLKLLNVYVQPDLNLADKEPNYPELAWIAATTIVGCLELTYGTYPADQLKLYTSFPLDKEFMTRVTTAIFSKGELAEMYDVSGHGPWIVVTKKPGEDVASAVAEAVQRNS